MLLRMLEVGMEERNMSKKKEQIVKEKIMSDEKTVVSPNGMVILKIDGEVDIRRSLREVMNLEMAQVDRRMRIPLEEIGVVTRRTRTSDVDLEETLLPHLRLRRALHPPQEVLRLLKLGDLGRKEEVIGKSTIPRM